MLDPSALLHPTWIIRMGLVLLFPLLSFLLTSIKVSSFSEENLSKKRSEKKMHSEDHYILRTV